MKSRRQLYLLIPAAWLTACSTTPAQSVLEPDYDYIQKVEASSKYNTRPNQIYWVNPPMKRKQPTENKQD